MTVGTPLKSVHSHRCGYITWSPTDHVQNTSREILGQNNTGMPILYPCRFTSMYFSGETSGGAAAQIMTMTAYKNSVAPGNRVFEITFTETGASDNISQQSTVPTISEDNCNFNPGDQLLVVFGSGATAGTLIEFFCALTYETDI